MNSQLSVLVVDDSLIQRVLLSSFVERMGYRVVTAESGEEAISVFVREQPNLVLMDVIMPGMGGYEAAAHLKKVGGNRWVPVVFVTADTRDGTFARGLTAGGDYYLTKPVQFALLQAQILAIQRTLLLHNDIEAKNRQLEDYRLATEHEREVASDLMQKIVNAELLNDPALHWWLAPAEQFSGDLIAAARNPQGKLHLILADGTGHGLAAAVNVMPIVGPFYTMTRKGFDLARIAQELNQKTCAWLPVERFIAATLVSVDFNQALIEVWNGGNPPCIVLNDKGRLLHSFAPQHPALGIMRSQQFNSTVEVFQFSDTCQLIAFSDGALMSHSSVQVVLDALIDSAPDQRMDRFKTLITTGDQEDDVTVMMVDCVPAHNATSGNDESDRQSALNSGVCRFNITFGIEQLKYLDPVSLALGFVERIEATRPHHSKIFLLLSELLTNAVDHGLLKLDSTIKQGADGFDRYLMLRKERLAHQLIGQIEMTLELTMSDTKPVLRIILADSGSGFDYQRVLSEAALPDQEHFHGRGIALLKALCLSLEYQAAGNQVVATYDLSTPVNNMSDEPRLLPSAVATEIC